MEYLPHCMHAPYCRRWCRQILTFSCYACLHYTPLSSSNFRHCSHSNSVLIASIQSSQNSGSYRRWAWDGGGIVPRCCSTSSVLHLVLRDGQVTLGSGPSHSQSECMRFYCLDQSNTTDSWGSCARGNIRKHSSNIYVYCSEFRCAGAANTAKRLMCRCRINDTPI